LFTYTDEVAATFTVHIIGFHTLTVFAYGTCLVNFITY